LQLQETINSYAALDKRYKLNPSEQEWEKIKELVMCLKVFYDATLKLSGTKYPTLNMFFPEFCEVYLSIKKWIVVHISLLSRWVQKCLLSEISIGVVRILY
jgi:hypothetical protein